MHASRVRGQLLCQVQAEAWEAGYAERGVQGVPEPNPHQEEIDLVSQFFEVEQKLQGLAAASDQVPAATHPCHVLVSGLYLSPRPYPSQRPAPAHWH